MQFEIIELNDYRLIVMDITRRSISGLPRKITSIRMNIISESIPANVFDLEILPYMFTKKIENQIYEIDSSTLGLPKNVRIPDGAYNFIFRINNTDEFNVSCLIVTEVQEKLAELYKLLPYPLEDLTKLNTSTKEINIIVKYFQAMSLYANLIQNIAEIYDSFEANKKLNELKRVLSITTEPKFII